MESSQSLRCAPTRRSLKFHAGAHAQHFILFGPSISKHDRMILYMELFAFIQYFVDTEAIPHFTPSRYLPEEYVELRVLTDPRHPAYGQIGLFAKNTIPANTVVTPYSGYIEIFSTSCSSRTYTMGFGSFGDEYALDAEFVGNYGRFANDPRGVEGLVANLTAESRFTPRGEAYTALVSRRIINKGEEILMSYGKAHSLTPSPWMGLKGELLTRQRAGGIVPFPQLMSKRRNGLIPHLEWTPVRRNLNSLASIEGHDDTARNCHKWLETSGGVSGAHSPAENENTEMVLLWECPQCGMWSIGSPTPVSINHCFVCRSPRLQRARMVAVCCSPSLSREDVLASVMRGVASVPSSPSGEQPPDVPFSTVIEDGNSASGTHITLSSEGSCVKSNQKGSGSSDTSGSATKQILTVPFGSEAVSWPLNVPFLPWQVWDSAVPLSAIRKHSRFETHVNIFLYAVNTASEEEHRPMGSEGKRGREEGEAREQCQQRTQQNQRGRRPRVRRKKEELWQKEELLPSSVHDHAEAIVASHSTRKCLGETKTAESGNATDYLFYISGSSLHGENQYDASDDNSEGAAVHSAFQSLLKGVVRRVFAGKSYQSGEVVAAVGGMILPTADRRRRPDGSVLEIPMKYFLPARVRRKLRGMQNGGKGPTNSEIDVEEAMSLSDLLRRLEGLSLIVTNELMFCPCLVLRDEEEKDDDYACTDGIELEGNSFHKRHPLIETCNVSFVLTMDALGCPYVAAVALKDINTFEPLLACVGS
ncbi:hypothetical protein MOQ_004530 [Trypanosoma cruzi marinkellei]|uniref:SET domain-containing protein n=1 Tax=Trypanosoma cruzi marinkellei TaxID=85056 RepID=K2N9V4_TRYCR|nr:hypothetical protein MOQ_004530 [Trypanosoma cruzi marinkellei]